MRILVIGSVNMDVVTRVDRVPAAGENVRGRDLATIPGGKGANQAVAAARLGAETALLGRVGDDEFGSRLHAELQAEGVSAKFLDTVRDCASGVALIMVDAAGENTIVVTPGANARLTPDDVDAARNLIAEADAVILQLEIPAETVARAIRLAREIGTRTVVDAGPPRRGPSQQGPRRPIDRAVFESTLLTPNEAEAASLLGVEPGEMDLEEMASELVARGPEAVVLKAGARGAVVAQGNGCERVPAFKIDPVDTTAAGDAFTAALAIEAVRGTNLVAAARIANAAGALACLTLGAQPSMPTAEEIARFIVDQSQAG